MPRRWNGATASMQPCKRSTTGKQTSSVNSNVLWSRRCRCRLRPPSPIAHAPPTHQPDTSRQELADAEALGGGVEHSGSYLQLREVIASGKQLVPWTPRAVATSDTQTSPPEADRRLSVASRELESLRAEAPHLSLYLNVLQPDPHAPSWRRQM